MEQRMQETTNKARALFVVSCIRCSDLRLAQLQLSKTGLDQNFPIAKHRHAAHNRLLDAARKFVADKGAVRIFVEQVVGR